MKVVHALTRLLQAGAEENTIATCLFQARRGWDVMLVHGREFDTRCVDKLKNLVKVERIDSLVHPISPLQDAQAFRDLRALYRRYKPDVVHTHQSKAGIVGRLAAMAMPDVAVVHTVHIAPFVNVKDPARAFYVGAERICARVSDAIISVSGGMRDAYLEHSIGSPDLHHVVYSGMELEKFTGAVAADDWRMRIGGWPGRRRPSLVLMVAAFEARKRHRQFLEAVASHLRLRDDVCVLFAGDGPERKACEEQVQSLGIKDKVRFLGFDPNPHELIALADLCVLVSEREGLPRAVVQYLAGGRPVIVTALPGIEALVESGVNGIVAPADDMPRAAQEIFTLLSDPVRLSALSDGARATDVSRWKLDRMGMAIEDTYTKAMAHAQLRHARLRHANRARRAAARGRRANGERPAEIS